MPFISGVLDRPSRRHGATELNVFALIARLLKVSLLLEELVRYCYATPLVVSRCSGPTGPCPYANSCASASRPKSAIVIEDCNSV